MTSSNGWVRPTVAAVALLTMGLIAIGFVGWHVWAILGPVLGIALVADGAIRALPRREAFRFDLASARVLIHQGQLTQGLEQLDELAAREQDHRAPLARYYSALARHLHGMNEQAAIDLATLEAWPGLIEASEARALGAYLRAEIEALFGHLDVARRWLAEAQRRTPRAFEETRPRTAEAMIAAASQDRDAFHQVLAQIDRTKIGEPRVRLLDVLAAYLIEPSLRDGNAVDELLARARISEPNPLVATARASWPELRAFLELHHA